MTDERYLCFRFGSWRGDNFPRIAVPAGEQAVIVVRANDSGDNEARSISCPRRKKPYKPPTLMEYGNVARLTAGVHGSNFDTGHGTRHRR